LQRIYKEVFEKKDQIPAYLLSQNISQESLLVIDLFEI
jgi:hypothetical protein